MSYPKKPVPVDQARDLSRAMRALRKAREAADEAVYEAFIYGGSRVEVARVAGVAVNTAQAMFERHEARLDERAGAALAAHEAVVVRRDAEAERIRGNVERWRATTLRQGTPRSPTPG